MWIRYHIQCDNCGKITNLRVQVPERETLPVKFQCASCFSELKGVLKINFKKVTHHLEMERGTLVVGKTFKDDYYYEFSDTLSTKMPSTEPHDIILPTFRRPPSEFHKSKDIKDRRKQHSKNEWDNLKDLTRAYERYDKLIIERLVKQTIGNISPQEILNYNNDLDYHCNYFLSLNYFMKPWIHFDKYYIFIKWLDVNIFNEHNVKNRDLLEFVHDVTDNKLCDDVRSEFCELIIRFIDLRDFFLYANNQQMCEDYFLAMENFNELKVFYTDCFEFIGRTSHLIFQLNNFHERGNLNSVPSGLRRDVTNASDFASLSNGDKAPILKQCLEKELRYIYLPFDNKLRNGINHFKAKLDPHTQVIFYYPIQNKPEKEYNIKYIDFLNGCINIFTSVLMVAQLIKFVTIYKTFTQSPSAL